MKGFIKVTGFCDGQALFLRIKDIYLVQDDSSDSSDQCRSIIYLDENPRGLGVRESCDEVFALMEAANG